MIDLQPCELVRMLAVMRAGVQVRGVFADGSGKLDHVDPEHRQGFTRQQDN